MGAEGFETTRPLTALAGRRSAPGVAWKLDMPSYDGMNPVLSVPPGATVRNLSDSGPTLRAPWIRSIGGGLVKKVRVARDDAALIYALGAAALGLSYTALADVAARAGLGEWQAAVWPLVVDGLIIAATRAAVTLDAGPARRYAWFLLWSAVAVSIAGNVAHLLLPPGPVHPAVTAAVAVVPPVAAMALTHLAIVRARALAGSAASGGENTSEAPADAACDAPASPASAQLTVVPVPELAPAGADDDVPANEGDALRHRARQLRDAGLSNYAIADEIGRSEATVRRWLAASVA